MSLVTDVGAKLGLTIDAGSKPTSTNVAQWLKDGHNILMRRLPIEYFRESISGGTIQTLKTSGDTDDATQGFYAVPLSENPVKFLGLYSITMSEAPEETATDVMLFTDALKFKTVSYDYIMEMFANRNPFKSINYEYPLVAIGNYSYSESASLIGKKALYIYYKRTANMTGLKYSYLSESAIATADTTTGDSAVVDELCVDYAFAQSQIYLEELQDVQLALQSFENRIAAMVGGGQQ